MMERFLIYGGRGFKTRSLSYSLLSVFIYGFVSQAAVKTSASSVLDNRSHYSHNNVVDGNLNTAWVEGSISNGKGEWVEVDFGEEKNPMYLGVIPGYLKYSPEGEDLWSADNQIRNATLVFSDSTRKNVFFHQKKDCTTIKLINEPHSSN